MAITNEGDSQSFPYTGGMQSFTAPVKGIYKLEVWGARGAPVGGAVSDNTTQFGRGGYGFGYRMMEAGETIYICCGQAGAFNASGTAYNGGARGSTGSGKYGGQGGGATHMATVSGTLYELGQSANASNVLLVAGGAGGGNRGWGVYQYAGEAGGGPSSSVCGNNGVTGLGSAGNGSYYAEDTEVLFLSGGGGGGWIGGAGGADWGCCGDGGSGYTGGVPSFAYDGVTYAPGWTTGHADATGNGFAKITFVKKGELPVVFSGTTLQRIIFNGTEITGLIVDGTRVFAKRVMEGLRGLCPVFARQRRMV